MYNFDFYRNKNITYPRHDIDPSKKDKKWHKRWAEAAYSKYINDRSAIPSSRRAEIELLRLYAIGNQPVEKYMDRLSPMDNKTGKRKGYMNVSWDILSVVPKFRAVVMGMFEKMDYDVYCNAIDEKSSDERTYMKWKVWAEKKMDEKLGPVEAQEKMGVAAFVPDSLEELQMMYEMGAFKLMQEIAMEKNLKWSFYLSSWKDIKRLLFEDMFDIGYAATKDYVDHGDSGKVKARYVDIKNMIANFSRKHTHDNLKVVGEVRGLTIPELRREAGNQISDTEMKEIANEYTGWKQNPDTIDFTGFYNSDSDYDNFDVSVVDMEFFDYDVQKYEEKKDKRGNKKFYKKDHKYNKKKSDTRTPHKGNYKTVRRVTWIIGTDYVYNWGYQNDVVTKGDNDVRLSYNLYKHSDKSILASLIPLVDNIQITWLKIQNAIAMSAPSGIKVDVKALSDITLGGQEQDPLDIIKLYKATGDILYSATTHHSEFNGSGGSPIERITGGVGPELQELTNIMSFDIDMIRQISGISAAMDASSLSAEVPVGTSKMQIGATNNIMHTMFVGYEYLKENTARNMAKRWQIVSRTRSFKGSYNPFGSLNTEIINISKGKTYADMGIKLEMQPTAEQIAKIDALALQSSNAKKQGGIGISLGDYMYIMRLLAENNLKLAQLYLQYKEAKDQQRMEGKQMELEQQRNQGAQELQAQKSEAEAAKIQVTEQSKGQREIEVETVKSELRIGERADKSELDKVENKEKHYQNLETELTKSADKYLESTKPKQ